MTATQRATLPNVFPMLRYRDAPAAIAWLERAFGLEQRLVVPGPNGTIAHAELGIGPGRVMLGSGKASAPPADDREECGHSVYVSVDDVDALCARAKEAGAQIVSDLRNTDYGSRDFAALDVEGIIWYFGTYLPGAEENAS